jgi:hypothetical protein
MPKNAPADCAHVYVITHLHVPHPHLSVQTAHAALAADRAYGEPHRTHPNLVLCAVEDEAALEDAFNALKDAGVPCVGWYEEDMGGRLTAVATGPLRGPERKPLRWFHLLTG